MKLKLKYKSIIKTFIISFFIVSCSQKNDTRPNIVLLLADDLGYNELGSYGQKIIKTPHIDSLAKKSMMFTDFYAGSTVCSPSRAVLLTGKSSSHVSIRGNAAFKRDSIWRQIALDKNEYTLGEMFKEAGYQSAFIGKWHLDTADQPETWAFSHGFDFAAQEQWGGSTDKYKNPGLWLNGNEEQLPYDFNKHDCKDAFYTDTAFKFLEEKSNEKPFFLFMSYRAPHSFEGPIRDTLWYSKEDWPKVEQAQAAKITLQDQQVGRLLEKLESMNELDNTIVLYTSDNGAHFNHDNVNGHQLEFFDSNGNLRGGKRDLYEGGLRVPLIVYWKNKIIPGSKTNHISGFRDIMTTFAEIIGIKKPSHNKGISFLPTLLNQKQKKHEFLNWEFQLSGSFQELPDGGFRQSVRLGDFKAVRYGINSKTEVYNLKEDESETNDIANLHPKIVEKAEQIFLSERSDTFGFPYGGVVQDFIPEN
ncbi:MAG: sulfatase-like hydrolase/transferase [Flavobacteriaceae bacterium]|nr:sulfatase-like hydrolase/transferase [Flavobacteriaceae bacterium]MBL6684620.1 sulfatase-like hydrolase/transferase [Flavobacteriaceae bacterium]